MEASGRASIKGEYRLKFSDQMAWTFSAPAKTIWTFSIGAALFAAFVIGHDYLNYGLSSSSLIAIATFVAVGAPLILVLMALLNAIFYFRLSNDQKNLRWMVDAVRLTLNDGAGNSIQFPWGQVKYIAERKVGALIALRPMGYRWIALRAFSSDEWSQVFDWAKASGIPARTRRKISHNPRS